MEQHRDKKAARKESKLSTKDQYCLMTGRPAKRRGQGQFDLSDTHCYREPDTSVRRLGAGTVPTFPGPKLTPALYHTSASEASRRPDLSKFKYAVRIDPWWHRRR